MFLNGLFLDLLGQKLFELETARLICFILIMAKGKRIRAKGKITLSKYFKNFSEGANVAIVPDAAIRSSFPKRLKGLSGKVVASRGKFKLVEVKEGKKLKTFIIHPIHLKRL